MYPEGGAKNVARSGRYGHGDARCRCHHREDPRPLFPGGGGAAPGRLLHGKRRCVSSATVRYGYLLRLHLAQNEPFTPMVSAWTARCREIIPAEDMPDAVESIRKVMSDVLTNRNPPYGIRGGLFDALQATKGSMYGISNAAGANAVKLIRETVGIDPDPAAAIATAALVQAVEKDIIGAGDSYSPEPDGWGIRADPRGFYPPPGQPRSSHPSGMSRGMPSWHN